jgi:hypothetical protein
VFGCLRTLICANEDSDVWWLPSTGAAWATRLQSRLPYLRQSGSLSPPDLPASGLGSPAPELHELVICKGRLGVLLAHRATVVQLSSAERPPLPITMVLGQRGALVELRSVDDSHRYWDTNRGTTGQRQTGVDPAMYQRRTC